MFTNQRMPEASDAGIERLVITSHLLQDCSDPAASTFRVQVNPDKVSYDFGVQRVGEDEKGDDHPMETPTGASTGPNAYQSYKPMFMNFEFYADATGVLPIPKGREIEFLIGGNTDNSERPNGQPSIRKHLDLLQNTVYGYEAEIHGPPFLKFIWGNIFPKTTNDNRPGSPPVFKGMLHNCKVDLMLFSLSGEPVKAKIQIKVKSLIPPEQRPLGRSPDLSHVYDITEGEKMTNYCQRIYGRFDTDICAAVAEYNGMIDWGLKGGMRIQFPSIGLLEEQYFSKRHRAELTPFSELSEYEQMVDMVGEKRAKQYFATFGKRKAMD